MKIGKKGFFSTERDGTKGKRDDLTDKEEGVEKNPGKTFPRK